MTDPNGYSGEKPAARETVVLPLGMTAEPHKCGSCHFFGRRNDVPGYMDDLAYKYNQGGYCKFKFPPHVEMRSREAEGSPTNWINDDGSCDLWRSSGKSYIVMHKVSP